MTTRHSGYIVALKEDIRDDDSQSIADALRLIKGVTSVTPIESSPHDAVLRMRLNNEMRERLYAIIEELR